MRQTSQTFSAAHRAPPGIQRGVAAVEFALIAIVMVTMLMGLFAFWNVFQTQQSLHRAAGDGLRHALTIITGGTTPCSGANAALARATTQASVDAIIKKSLQNSGLSANSFRMTNPQWSCTNTGAGNFSFDAQYNTPLLLSGDQGWIKYIKTLEIKEKMVVHFQPIS